MRLQSRMLVVAMVLGAALTAPVYAANDAADGAAAHPEPLADRGLCEVAQAPQRSDLPYLLFSELGGAGRLSECDAVFARRIGHVGVLIPDVQVIRPDARRAVTVVAEERAIGNRPDEQLVPDSMRQQDRLVLLARQTNLGSDSTIAVRVLGAGPQPTGLGLLHLAQPAITQWHAQLASSSGRVAWPRAVFRAASRRVSWRAERHSADSADSRDGWQSLRASLQHAMQSSVVEFQMTDARTSTNG
jgi:hypothetical protein